MFERLLGIEMKREQYRQGRVFCDAVADLSDEATLARMWESPEAMCRSPSWRSLASGWHEPSDRSGRSLPHETTACDRRRAAFRNP